MYESGLRLLYSEVISESKNILIASGVMVFSAFGGLGIQKSLEYWQKRSSERSLSVEADQGHYMTDVWLNLFGALGLGLVWYFKNLKNRCSPSIVSSISSSRIL